MDTARTDWRRAYRMARNWRADPDSNLFAFVRSLRFGRAALAVIRNG